jgi:aminoglycoside phosphotransferase (APT) family kinase protein
VLLDALAPGGRVVRVERLRGGISCSVHAVRLEAADGARRDVVVRRFSSEYHTDKGIAAREFRVLEMLSSRGYPCPLPLLLQEDDAVFGSPTLVMTRLPGSGTLAPRDLDSYLEQLARSLARLHGLPTDEFAFLPEQLPGLQRLMERGPQSTDALQQEIWAALREYYPSVQKANRRVVQHGDFWPGNTVWHRGQLSGVVDWEMVRLGDPAKDVATCRCDISNVFGPDAARAFTRLYERERGEPAADLPFWDLRQAAQAMRYMGEWVVGYQDLGRTEVTFEVGAARTAEFARDALAQLRA